MLTTTLQAESTPLRDHIISAYRMDEETALKTLVQAASLPPQTKEAIYHTAKQLVLKTREAKKRQSRMDALLHQYDLSTEEGIALMCLAEALLRIPDKETMDKFISDKLSTVDWKNHLDKDNSFFINATTWSLLLTGKLYAPQLDDQKDILSTLKRVISRLGSTMIRPIILQMMKAIGNQFVMGQSIDSALKRAADLEETGYRFSYDMLGEAARTEADAQFYFQAYVEAIDAIGKEAKKGSPAENPGISIKLSALHPRYDFTQHERVMKELPPLLLALAKQAKQYNIGLTVDAEEADRLDLSLDIFEEVFLNPALDHWEGFGLAVQAYQKRAPFVLDWLADLSKQANKRIMVRLVKGAYWDAEIKTSQMYGFQGYPVFTRKNATDVSYLACAKKLLNQPNCFYPQFGTHNAYSVAAIIEMAKLANCTQFEFQCLHGMGRTLYDHVVDANAFNLPCRIYAPVGTHKDLLGYLVRRLLENGANSSFVNRLADDKTPIDAIIIDPVERIASLGATPHPHIPLPKAIYGGRENSAGIDLSNPEELAKLQTAMEKAESKPWQATPLIAGVAEAGTSHPVTSPSEPERIIGSVTHATAEQVTRAIDIATTAKHHFGRLPVSERAAMLNRAADLLQTEMPALVSMLGREGGKCMQDSISEVREAIDFCRYYAERAQIDLAPQDLPGPTGEANQLSLHPRGVLACISPWNFPLAIFCGQIVAALAAGNCVIAKPAEQTPLIAYHTVKLLHEAGIPKEALQLLPGEGEVVGAALVKDPRIAGVIFTGSTETAKAIEQSLANRPGPLGFLIAETGGQNAMIVDSSALPEQAVMDIVNSAFNSAGQRCSALRVLFVQDEIAPKLLAMLSGFMAELRLGNPRELNTDIGPVIDMGALQLLKSHLSQLESSAKLIAKAPLNANLAGFYFAPCAYELNDMSTLTREVFGPILHVIRYRADQLDAVLDQIVNTGYGLTLGIHSRIDATIQYITHRMPIGNVYVNRNMIGAVVGVQPFGGERLSGTGPKAGGPHYLPRLCVERTISTNTTAVGGNARLVSLLEDDS